jgi:hypothetical protein
MPKTGLQKELSDTFWKFRIKTIVKSNSQMLMETQ